MKVSFVWMVVSYVCILLSVAFFTLFERKGLGYVQIRKGPNKVGYMGVIQPLADALKLFLKEESGISVSNKGPYYVGPGLSLVLSLCLWSLYWTNFSVWSMELSVMFFLCVSALNVYGTMVSGWASNSKYSLLGALRAVAQTISYEVSLFLLLLSVISLSGSLSFSKIGLFQYSFWNMVILFPVFFMWLVVCVAETNRAPFDFAEGESELVSGFNVEYGGGVFALIFLAEYASILFMSMMTSIIFLGEQNMSIFSLFFFWSKVVIVSFFFIWIRGTYPRFRYDLLMKLTWLSLLPVSLFVLVWGVAFKFLVVVFGIS
ncbi:NADH dehydrogenase subunit 1 (mitochondrion) [Liolophura japonica]|uniref:NADH dehydrogenase subunit 1 n=1 Tax=Liolophura japonica TaxID=13599 RepID=UPI0023D8BAA3|nr:NADH dehydrogenase subunit 1 [Liolophura japonica]WDQ44250.1 NADH dehydrogenase subunit 1 [Liolophura japonica]